MSRITEAMEYTKRVFEELNTGSACSWSTTTNCDKCVFANEYGKCMLSMIENNIDKRLKENK